jgi:RecD/TraA family predicted helicase
MTMSSIIRGPIRVDAHRKHHAQVTIAAIEDGLKVTLDTEDLLYLSISHNVKGAEFVRPKHLRLVFDGCHIAWDRETNALVGLEPPNLTYPDSCIEFMKAWLQWVAAAAKTQAFAAHNQEDGANGGAPVFPPPMLRLYNKWNVGFSTHLQQNSQNTQNVLAAWLAYLEECGETETDEIAALVNVMQWYYGMIRFGLQVKHDSHHAKHPLTQKELASVLMSAKSYEDFRGNPYYCLHDMDRMHRVRFKPIDALAKQYQVPITVICLEHLQHQLRTIADQDGHACFPKKALIHTAYVGMRHQHPMATMKILDEASEDLVEYKGCVYLPHAYKVERVIADKVVAFVEASANEQLQQSMSLVPDKKALVKHLEAWQNESGMLLNAKQRFALEQLCLETNLFMLTGYPGTGKSAVVAFIKHLCNTLELSLLMCAPTGKAANVMGPEAMTLHRALECMVDNDGRMRFAVNAKNPFKYNIIVVDESSMLDNVMAYNMLSAIDPTKTKLLLIGDKQQLPPVAYGDVLGQLLKSGVIPMVELTKIYRQGKGSAICKFARMISENNISRSILTDYPKEISWVRLENHADILTYVRDAYVKRKSEVQILCAGKRGMVGVPQLNGTIHNVNFPSQADMMCNGDRVVCNKNTYCRVQDADGEYTIDMDKSAFNGETGLVTGTKGTKVVIVRFDVGGKVIEMDREVMDWGYALTTHRSQGSQYPEVILVLHKDHDILLTKELVYTAATRAKTKLVVVSDEYCILKAAATPAPKRHSKISDMINEVFVCDSA